MRINFLPCSLLLLSCFILPFNAVSQVSDTTKKKDSIDGLSVNQAFLGRTLNNTFQSKNWSLSSHHIMAKGRDELKRVASIDVLKQIKDLQASFNGTMLKVGTINLASEINNTSMNDGTVKEKIYYSTRVNSSSTVLNVPFNLNYNSGSELEAIPNRLSFGSMRFDKENFIKQLKEKSTRLINPEEFFASSLNQLYEKRNQAFALVNKDLNTVLRAANPTILKEFESKINLENFSYLGVDDFLNRIITSNDNRISELQSQFLNIQGRETSQGENMLGDSLNKLASQIEALQKTKSNTVAQLESLKSKWVNEGTVQTIQGFDKDKKTMLENLMNDPSQIAKMAESKLKLNGLQKILLYAKNLNVGSGGIDQSSLTVKDALLNGINANFLKGNRFFAPIIGTQPGIKNISDFAYSNFNELPDILSTAIRLGKGDAGKEFSHVSFGLFQQNNNQQFLPTAFHSSLPKNFVTTFSKKVSLAESHSLLTEVSKSTMLYNGNGGSEALKSTLNSQNLFGNMGIVVDYNGSFEKIGIEQKLLVRYTGNEYANLGNAFLVSGTKEISNDIKKYFFNRKLILNAKVQFREYDFSTEDRKWRNLSYVADLKWKMKKGEFIELRFQPYINSRSTREMNYVSNQSHRLAIRGNVNRKVGRGLTYRNFMEAATSKDFFYDPFADKFYSSQFTSFTSLQTLVVRNHTLFLNVTGNYAKQNTGYLFGNSSISLDAGTSFFLSKGISYSSSLVFNRIDELYTQIAIRQSVSAVIGKRITVEGFLHAGKNFYQQSYLTLPPLNGNVSISYNVK